MSLREPCPTSSLRSGSAIRSSSRRPWASNRQSSTFSALAENSAKLVPLPSQLAARGLRVSSDTRLQSAFGEEEDGSQRRKGEIKFMTVALHRLDAARVPYIAAAIMGRIGVERL